VKNKEEILRNIEAALTEFVSQDVQGPMKEEMKMAVSKFFKEEVSQYGDQELKEKFKNPDAVVKQFSEFLDRTKCIVC
jgi:hypothetical protein